MVAPSPAPPCPPADVPDYAWVVGFVAREYRLKHLARLHGSAFTTCGADFDDMRQDLWVAALTAVPRYDPANAAGARLSTFLVESLRCRAKTLLMRRIRRHLNTGIRVYGEDGVPVSGEDGDADPLSYLGAVRDDGFQLRGRLFMRDFVARWLPLLTPAQRAAVEARWDLAESGEVLADIAEVAAKLGVSERAVKERLSRAEAAARLALDAPTARALARREKAKTRRAVVASPDRERIVVLFGQDHPIQHIAKRFRVSRMTVRAALREAGVELPPPAPARVHPLQARAAEIAARLDGGESLRSIARDLGVEPIVIRRVLERHRTTQPEAAGAA